MKLVQVEIKLDFGNCVGLLLRKGDFNTEVGLRFLVDDYTHGTFTEHHHERGKSVMTVFRLGYPHRL